VGAESVIRDSSNHCAADIGGAVIGVEKVFEKSLIGIAGGTASTKVNTDEPGSSDVDTWNGSLYGSCGTDSWFVDSNISYSHNSIKAERGTLYISDAEYDAQNAAAYISGGKQLQLTDRFVLTPELGGQLNYYHQDEFTEYGIVNNTYDAYDYWFFKSILGANAALSIPTGEKLLFRPELRLQWIHNFNSDPGRITYSTEGTGTGSSAGIQSPEEDTLGIGAGLVTEFADRINIDLRIDQQLADGWESTTFSGSLKVQF
jgi:uncharacterized protein with beta-barrel porin domain